MTADWVKPKRIRLEASSACQLRCPSCPTTQGLIKEAVGTGYLKPEDFAKLLNDNPWIEVIEISNWGEIFLNPHLLDIMRCAYEKGIGLEAYNGVNLNYAREDVLEGLVRYQFRGVTCSIDGASQETYEQYRIRGNFSQVMENIAKINGYKKKYDSSLPRLTWQFVIFGHNEHEIPVARKMASDLGMKFVTKLAWNQTDSPVKDKKLVQQETGKAYTSEKEYREMTGVRFYRHICTQLWNTPQINWDGRNLGCCVNYWGDFGGNAFQDGLLETINHEKIRYARGMLTGQEEPREDIPCTKCWYYKDLRKNGRYLTSEEIESV